MCGCLIFFNGNKGLGDFDDVFLLCVYLFLVGGFVGFDNCVFYIGNGVGVGVEFGLGVGRCFV